MTTLTCLDADARRSASEFVGRVALWDPKGPIRLINGIHDVSFWARTSFGVWACYSVPGQLNVPNATVYATDLVTALVLATGLDIDAGSTAEDQWRGRMPPTHGWITVDTVSAERMYEKAVAAARIAQAASDAELTALGGLSKKATAPLDLLDQGALTVGESPATVTVTVRMMLGLSAIGFIAAGADSPVTIRATASWLRIDTDYGSVFRHGTGLPPIASAARSDIV